VLSFYFILSERDAYIANFLYNIIILPVAWNTLRPGVALRFSVVLFGISIYASITIREIYRQHFLLKRQAITDSLTGLYNRSIVDYSLKYAIHISKRSGIPMSLIMIDIDYFKKINDTYGHDMGDAVLKSMGSFLKSFFRNSDMVFRVGGEEFLALLYNTDRSSGIILAQKLRKNVEQLVLVPQQKITISIGVCDLQPHYDPQEWMKKCDENLYQTKNGGRNQVVG